MTKIFEREKNNLKESVIELATQVEKQLKDSIRCLSNSDMQLANSVIQNDETIDVLEVTIEEECLKLLALHQPVATDLRLIVSGIKMNNELERIGDLACNIAKCTKGLNKLEPVDVPEKIFSMCKKARLMLRKALLAFHELDADIAHQVLDADDDIDQLNSEMHIWVAEQLSQGSSTSKQHIFLLSVSKHLERIADHASNIAEEVIYIREGTIVRHGRLSEASH